MSKGNLFLGYARGSVGDVVMSRVKGQQVAKARNRKPANPKSKKQMTQRSSFISPVKFYTHGVQALFKFAFSDRKVTESDFNAFMRNNAKVAFPVTKAENDDPGFPALGNYMMSKGKLAEMPVVLLEENTNKVALDLSVAAPVSTVAQLSAEFVAAGIAEEGDIITFVGIHETVASALNTELIVGAGNAPKWTLNQFVVDSSNPVELHVAMPDVSFHELNGKNYLSFDACTSDAGTNLFAMAVVRSRETALGLEVSNAYLKNGGYIDGYISYRNTPAQVAKVLADWGATGDAILQGSIAKK